MKKFKVGQIVEDYDGIPLKVTNTNVGDDRILEVEILGTQRRIFMFKEDLKEQGVSKATVITVVVVGFLVLCAIVSLIVNWF